MRKFIGLFRVLRVQHLDARVAEMHLEALDVRELRAALDLLEGVVLERIEAAEGDEAVRDARDLPDG